MTKKYTEEELAPLLTDEFLALLAIAVKVYGYGGDWIETTAFCRFIYKLAGKECPSLLAYDEDE